MGQTMRMSIDRWPLVVVAATALAVAAFAVISWQSYERLREDRIAQAHTEGQRALLTVSDRTTRLLDSADSFLRVVRAEYQARGLGEPLRRFIDETKPLHADSFSSVMTFSDQSGKIVFSTSPGNWQGLSSVGIEHFETFRRDPRDRVFIDPTRKGVVTGKYQFRVVRPLLKNGAFDGDVLLALLPEEIADFFEQFRLGPHSVLSVVSLDRRLIARHPLPPDDAFGKPLDKLTVWSRLAASPAGDYAADSQIDGIPRRFFYRGIDGYPLVVLIGIAERDVLDGLAGARRDAVVQGVTFALAASLFCALVLMVLRRNRTLSETHGLLKESQDLSRALMNAFKESFLLIEPNGRLLALNEPFARKYEQSVADIVGGNVFDLFSADVAKQRRQWVEDVVRTRAGISFTDELEGRFYEHHLYPVIDAGGEVRRIAISASDVTERKRGEAALKEVGDRLNLALQSAGAGAWDWDIPSNTAFWDQRMFDIYQRRPDSGEHLFEMWMRCLHPDDAGRALREVEDALARQPLFDSEYRILWPDGEVRTIKASAIVARDGDGRPLRMTGMNWDITTLRRAEQGLRESQNLLNAVSSLQSEFILTANARRISDRALMEILRATGSQYGFYDELIDDDGPPRLQALAISNNAWDDSSRRFYDEHAPGGFSFTNFDGLFAAAVAAAAPVIANDPAAHPSFRGLPPGHPPLDAFMGVPLFQGDTVVGCLGLANRPGGYDEEILHFIEPLTTACAQFIAGYRVERERRQAVEALLASKLEAERANTAKSMFLAMMSHEIRTPITSVLGMADLLQRTPLSEEQLGYVRTLGSSTKTLLTILNDILDISKLEAGKIEVETAVFQLHDVLRDTVELGRGGASDKGLAIDLAIAETVPRTVSGDSTRLRQVLFNLLNNAIKFTESGFVRVRASLRRRDGDTALVLTEVEDSGIGIDDDQLGKLFVAFSQADQSTTRRFGGTGLGLAITKRLVELMGGEIGVDSRSGEGARFWFTLPFTVVADGAAEPSPPAGEAPAVRGGRPLRILVAEDNQINQKLIQSMLRKFGHHVDAADNGRMALEMVISGEYDAVLMDMQMPEMDGEEATRAIRALPGPKRRMPVIALTADVMVEHRDRYSEAGVDALVAKPIDWGDLSSALERLTGAAKS